jgi:hypothetical protein
MEEDSGEALRKAAPPSSLLALLLLPALLLCSARAVGVPGSLLPGLSSLLERCIRSEP